MSDERGVIILIGSQKGGVAKTTLATNISTYMAYQGADVLLVDADKQKNSQGWANRRQERIEEGEDIPTVHCVEKTGDLKAFLLDAAKRYDAVVVDVSGSNDRALRTSALACDIACLPVQASAFDLETADFLQQLLEETQDINPDRIVRVVITLAPTGTGMTDVKEAKEFLADYEELMPISRNVTRYRKIYRTAALLGSSVIEMNDSKAKAEIQLIGQELVKLATEGEPA
jgi:chromosome partitioning protein